MTLAAVASVQAQSPTSNLLTVVATGGPNPPNYTYEWAYDLIGLDDLLGAGLGLVGGGTTSPWTHNLSPIEQGHVIYYACIVRDGVGDQVVSTVVAAVFDTIPVAATLREILVNTATLNELLTTTAMLSEKV